MGGVLAAKLIFGWILAAETFRKTAALVTEGYFIAHALHRDSKSGQPLPIATDKRPAKTTQGGGWWVGA